MPDNSGLECLVKVQRSRALSRDEKPQPQSGTGAFCCRDGDTTKHFRYGPSQLLVSHGATG
jgi:hypothetical protein